MDELEFMAWKMDIASRRGAWHMMKKICWTALSTIFAFVSMVCIHPVSASSWGFKEPQKVVNEADVIVMGKFDFTRSGTGSGGIFFGFPFNVEHVYKGEADRQIVAGVDGYFMNTAEEFQEEGGEYLLLLERRDRYDFPVTVSGPNGMVRMIDGEVIKDESRKEFYEAFLNEHSPHTSYPSYRQQWLRYAGYTGAGVVGLVVLVFVVRYYRRKRRTE